ncbi:acyltransferase family protein [Saccharicrinis sp. FJH62]|uniref:acyltransferase family protein n=1 Tax=Saccharicrinis sp. FJH62 TaxID=3344657 RepID=UPI0035D4051C
MTTIFNYKSDRLNGLDHLRALAILMVMIFHYGRGIPSWLEPLNRIGWTGVDLFFVLSGYLIGYQLLKEYKNTSGINFKRFYIKRFFRIIPVYLAVLILYYSLLPNLREGGGLPPLWRFLTFTQNFGLDVQTQKSFSHAWSLCIEEQFYLLLPITITLFFKSRGQKFAPYVIAGLIILGFIIRMYNWNEYVKPFIDSGNRRQMVYNMQEKIYYPSYNRMDGLLIGVSIAAIFNFKPRIKEFLTKHGNIVLVCGILLFLFAYKICENFISYQSMIYGFPLISLAYGVIVIAAISPTCILYKIKMRFTLIIATLSYAVYLIHKEVYYLVKMLIDKSGNPKVEPWTFWISVMMAILVGVIMHVIIEKPFLRLRTRLLG